jgi:hypothetical protein
MTTPQKEFTVTLPSVDNATPPNALTVGEITSLVFVIGGTNYAFPVPATTPVGASVTALFAALTPVFAPAAGTSYTADCFAVDSNGNGQLSNSLTWTQAAAVPAAPTNFSVA